MRLINAKSLLLHEFYGTNIPPYVILSHTWGDDEVTFKDWENPSQARQKAGFAKIRGVCSKALGHNIDWVWVDTNCIDKTSSAELTEAINSMFDWYAQAEICYAYLSDVPSANAPVEDIGKSRWFSRGWTLQELLAPKKVTFYAADWSRLGSKAASLAGVISEATGVHRYFLTGTTPVQRACIAEKMSWLSKGRTTTRTEDMAYCMLGLFKINMPLLYGEGAKAFTRLQREIISTSNDHTIFCWTWDKSVPQGWTSFLAPAPAQFSGSGIFTPALLLAPNEFPDQEVSAYWMTNAGLSIRLPVIYTLKAYFVVFEASPKEKHGDNKMLTCFQICGFWRGGVLFVMRAPFPRQPVFIPRMSRLHLTVKTIMVMNRLDNAVAAMGWRSIKPGWASKAMLEHFEAPGQFKIPGIILAFDSRDVKKRWGILEQTHAAINNYFGVIKFDLTGSHSGPQVGAVLIHMVAEDGNRMSMAIGVKVHPHTVQPTWTAYSSAYLRAR
ncbi:heterokaryon incompatibility protein-domain-containing protein [Coniochaeta sp. 2T2.1]|nr:heterokaryon incompatibility protein-domain-containing protein [Coniochaeta sp. 2T2.1]